MSNLPRATTLDIIPPDRIVGAAVQVTTIEPSFFDHWAELETQWRLEQQLADHVKRNRAKRSVVPRWHHWRIGRLAINWRWCNGK